MPRFFKRALVQAMAIAALGTALALAANHFRPDGLPLMADWSPQARFSAAEEAGLAVSLAEARALHARGAVFLDARSPREYRAGHVKGALNLPWESFEEHFDAVMSDVPTEAAVVTYCDGEGCDLSHELALALQAFGYTNVRVLVNGWTLWREAGLPLESGPGRGGD